MTLGGTLGKTLGKTLSDAVEVDLSSLTEGDENLEEDYQGTIEEAPLETDGEEISIDDFIEVSESQDAGPTEKPEEISVSLQKVGEEESSHLGKEQQVASPEEVTPEVASIEEASLQVASIEEATPEVASIDEAPPQVVPPEDMPYDEETIREANELLKKIGQPPLNLEILSQGEA
jgi:hypothetical protein